ncbi:MAG: glutathione transferase GstA [Gammaproteobacteria bacterium]|nr:glutathione transferase GstA [Gammaproteobacteria bacterium]MDE2348977.1 glutathione transferase GstA [Gammaproteobacteria bacterium]
MKLYYSPGACSLAPHIALCETGLPFTTEKVDLQSKKTATGADYRQINAKGSVPALALDDGQVLTEVAVVLQYIADRKPDAHLAPAAGSLERYRLMELLNYVATEVHKGFSPLWNPKASADWKAGAHANLAARFDWLSSTLKGKPYLMGAQFSVADAYLFTVLSWSSHVGVELAKWPVLAAYMSEIGHRPKVEQALREEGLIS